MITNEKINEIIASCREAGYEVRVRDISFVLLCRFFQDREIPYRTLIDNSGQSDEAKIAAYADSERIAYISSLLSQEVKQAMPSSSPISFNENFQEMLEVRQRTKEALAAGRMEEKDGLKILADISVKLNDKFGVNDATSQQVVIVDAKYNSICQCGRELYIPTKEELMKKYNLIENKK